MFTMELIVYRSDITQPIPSEVVVRKVSHSARMSRRRVCAALEAGSEV